MKKNVYVVRFDPSRGSPVAGLMQLFGMDEQTAQQLVMSVPMVVKRDATPETAEQIRAALESLGAEVTIKDAPVAAETGPLEPAPLRSVPLEPAPLEPRGIAGALEQAPTAGGWYDPPAPTPDPPRSGAPAWLKLVVVGVVLLVIAFVAQYFVRDLWAERDADLDAEFAAAADRRQIDEQATALMSTGDCYEARTWIREEYNSLAGLSPEDGRALISAMYTSGSIQVQACEVEDTSEGSVGRSVVGFVVPGLPHGSVAEAGGPHGEVLEGSRYVIVRLR